MSIPTSSKVPPCKFNTWVLAILPWHRIGTDKNAVILESSDEVIALWSYFFFLFKLCLCQIFVLGIKTKQKTTTHSLSRHKKVFFLRYRKNTYLVPNFFFHEVTSVEMYPDGVNEALVALCCAPNPTAWEERVLLAHIYIYNNWGSSNKTLLIVP